MITGFNHNLLHKGVLFHIQTEDSGVKNPHIITHVFVGGNIIATKKTSYSDIVKSDKMEIVVKEIMQEQHKDMMKNLKNGMYDNNSLVTQALAKGPITEERAREITKEEGFGAELISDKSLDEVILDYLSGESEEK